MTIGERIKMLRKKNRMTLEDVSKYINIGVPTIYKYENGDVTNIPSDKIEMLARLYNVSPSFIMGWEPENEDGQPDIVLQDEKVRVMIQNIKKLSPDQLERLTQMFDLMFDNASPEVFKKGNGKHDT